MLLKQLIQHRKPWQICPTALDKRTWGWPHFLLSIAFSDVHYVHVDGLQGKSSEKDWAASSLGPLTIKMCLFAHQASTPVPARSALCKFCFWFLMMLELFHPHSTQCDSMPVLGSSFTQWDMSQFQSYMLSDGKVTESEEALRILSLALLLIQG